MILLRRVVGDSMQPALRAGQVVLAVRWPRLHVGDVVVIRHKNLEKIKRISAMSGRRLFVLGDNLANSTDSRSFGWIGRRQVRGRVVWPRLTVE